MGIKMKKKKQNNNNYIALNKYIVTDAMDACINIYKYKKKEKENNNKFEMIQCLSGHSTAINSCQINEFSDDPKSKPTQNISNHKINHTLNQTQSISHSKTNIVTTTTKDLYPTNNDIYSYSHFNHYSLKDNTTKTNNVSPSIIPSSLTVIPNKYYYNNNLQNYDTVANNNTTNDHSFIPHCYSFDNNNKIIIINTDNNTTNTNPIISNYSATDEE